MTSHYDVIVIGAGPAGMSAAQTAAARGARVLVLDEQRSPGGQIYRAIENQENQRRPELGASYLDGVPLTRAFRQSELEYVSGASVWHLSADLEVGYSREGAARIVSAARVIIATGAQERPVPIPGWTKRGVMTVGAAQILLKESSVVAEHAVFAGTGPLLYLAVHQLLELGVPVKAVLDLTPAHNYVRALPAVPGALSGLSKIFEGWQWKRAIRAAGIQLVTGIEALRIAGGDSIAAVEFQRRGSWQSIVCDTAFLHLGVVPNINLAMAAGCDCHWDDRQACWAVSVDEWFNASVPGVIVAGDAGSIGGAVAAELRGRISALDALHALSMIDTAERDRLAAPLRKRLRKEMGVRRFLDVLFRPADWLRIPRDAETVVCRCEEVTVGQVRETLELGCRGPNQLKSFSRAGMGPCQGRFCGHTVSELIADACAMPVDEVGYFRLRPPIKPLSLKELADLAVSAED